MLLALVVPQTSPQPSPQPSSPPPPQHYHSSIQPLPATLRADLKHYGFWSSKCPVGLSSLRVLTVTHRDFYGRAQTGQLVVNIAAAHPLARVFHQLYRHHFPIRHMQLRDVYGPARDHPPDNDMTASFQCRQAVPSPCTGGKGTGSWSMHAYGLAVDVNPRENPYIGCGQSHDPATLTYGNRSRHRRGMVTAGVIKAFRSVGWGWGGAWPGSTHDYMHFSSTVH